MREVGGSEATGEQRYTESDFDERVDLDDVRAIVYETTVEGMARPVNTTRRAEVLAAAADYVLSYGLAGLSLRPLAKALGTSPRMLLYDFGSKERLIADVLAEIRRREERLLDADVHTLDDVWHWISTPEREAFLRLFFEVYVDAMKRREASVFVEDWLAFLSSRIDEVTATLLIAVVRGLLLDRLATGDKPRTDAALALAAQALPAF
jgi:AcrR family transcriptional regulator